MTAKSTAEQGNLLYQVYQATDKANTLILFEGYENKAALAAHHHSDHYRKLIAGKIITLLDDRQIIAMQPAAR